MRLATPKRCGRCHVLVRTLEELGSHMRGECRRRLSPRETQILTLLALGKSNKQIARVFGTSPSTVTTQIGTMFKKLHVLNRTQAVMVAAAQGLVSLPKVAV